MASTPILHGYFRSSCSYRVRIALNYKKIAYENRGVNLLKGEHKTEDYLKVNPQGMVPMLEIDGMRLTQSPAILEFLEENYGQKDLPLLPEAKEERHLARKLSAIIACDTQPIQNLPVLLHVEKLGGITKVDWAQHYIKRGFAAYEKILVDNSAESEFSVGSHLSFADICLMAQIYNAQRFGVQLEEFPRIHGVFEHIRGIEAVRNAHPHQQPDCPEELRGTDM